MLAAVFVFIVTVPAVFGAYVMFSRLAAAREQRALDRRLQELKQSVEGDVTLVREELAGPLPLVDRLIGGSGSWLARLIEQADARKTPSSVIVSSLVFGGVLAAVSQFVLPGILTLLGAFAAGASVPVLWLMRMRSARLKKFEEQFPEALELVSRSVRAGHAFQASLGMVADELQAPVGPEFKKIFEQQNFGLPLRDALTALADRVPLLDVKFFVTAVSIQRDTGGNLAEILDNLAHVVRERFKLLRQVQVHTAHGRITGLILLALPAFLAVALSFINPEHMRTMFVEPMGQTMLGVTVVMQTIGFLWIRQIMKIEV
jgi:tight adherence protein B